MLEENVVSAAGTSHTGQMNLARMQELIRDAGYEVRRRDTRYRLVATAPQPAALRKTATA